MPEEIEHFLHLVCFSPVNGVNGEREKDKNPDQEVTIQTHTVNNIGNLRQFTALFFHKAEYTRLLASKVKRIYFITTVWSNVP